MAFAMTPPALTARVFNSNAAHGTGKRFSRRPPPVSWNNKHGPTMQSLTGEYQHLSRRYGCRSRNLLLIIIPRDRSTIASTDRKTTYVWQDYDLAPEFPEMRKFMDFWQQTLDGPLHSIRYSHKRLIGPNEWRQIDGEFNLD